NWAARALLGARIRVGFWTFSIVQAMVADLPEPVMPSRVWKRSPASMPAASSSMACGWSPEGANSDTTWKGGMPPQGTGDLCQERVRDRPKTRLAEPIGHEGHNL